MTPGWKLIDVEERNCESPKTFKALPRREREELVVGQFVKIGVHNPAVKGLNGERFWVKLADVRGDHTNILFCGVIDNDLELAARHGLDCGALIEFGPQHVLQISLPPAGAQGPPGNVSFIPASQLAP